MASNSDRRIDRLLPALSAKERALFTLQAWKEGREIDPAVRATVPMGQINTYNHYIGILRAVSGDLTHYIVIVLQLIEQLDLRYAWLMTLVLWANNMDALKRHLDLPKASPLRKLIDRAPLGLVDDPESLPRDEDAPSMESLAGLLIDRMREGIVGRSRELRAVEIVLDEFSEELDGADLLHPEVRTLLDDGKANLDELRESMQRFGPMVEPDEPPMLSFRRCARSPSERSSSSRVPGRRQVWRHDAGYAPAASKLEHRCARPVTAATHLHDDGSPCLQCVCHGSPLAFATA